MSEPKERFAMAGEARARELLVRLTMEHAMLLDDVQALAARVQELEAELAQLRSAQDRYLERANQEIGNRQQAQVYASRCETATARMALKVTELEAELEVERERTESWHLLADDRLPQVQERVQELERKWHDQATADALRIAELERAANATKCQCGSLDPCPLHDKEKP